MSLRNLIQAEIVPDVTDGAFIAFFQEGNPQWRLAFLSKKSSWDDEQGFSKEETHPHRYTFLVGPSETCKTPADRLFSLISKAGDATLDDILKAFAVEPVSKAFFDEYKEHYQNFVEFLTGKRLVKDGSKWQEKTTGKPYPNLKEIFPGTKEESEKGARDFAKKMLGRLVFLYFVQKKGWMQAPIETDPEKKQNLIQAIFDLLSDKENYYKKGLIPLFFYALNQPDRANNEFTLPDGSQTQVPFLNGGLFDMSPVDVRSGVKDLNFPAHYFCNPDYKEQPQSNRTSAQNSRGFLDFLNSYNFTVDEDSPGDHTIAVDPEMLGHIFENLLEDNKEKGAYYTPKRIVHFMCQECLIEHLLTKVEGPEDELRPAISDFIKDQLTGGISQLDIEDEILQALREVKICDPAIGSGAFPMGILQEIFQAVECIWDNKPDSVKDTWQIESDHWQPAKVKLDIIQNSIYGVDIDAGAVDIARLRFWLSLIVDEEEPRPLPNFDYKIVVGNSLLSKFEGEVLEIDWDIQLQSQIHDQLSETAKQINELAKKVKAGLQAVVDKQKEFFNAGLAAKGGISNEIREEKLKLLQAQLTYSKARYQERNPFNSGFFLSKKEEKENDAIEAQLDQYDAQIARCQDLLAKPDQPFQHFDWQLDFPEVMNEMFAEKKGFDIVIANPPYMRVQEITKNFKEDKPFLEAKFEVANKSYDLANIFFELAAKTLSANECQNAFIFPHKFFNAASGESFRDFLIKGKYIDKIAHFGANMVFNDADTYTCIAFFSKRPNEGFLCQKFPFKSDYYALMENEGKYSTILYDQLKIASKLYGTNQWIFFNDSDEYLIFSKIYDDSKKIEDVFEDIFQGIATSKDKLYFLENAVIENGLITGFNVLADKDYTLEADLFKPLLKGRDVHRYKKLETQTYVFFPYLVDGENVKEVSLNELRSNYRRTYDFVIENEDEFKKRESGKAGKMSHWFGYIYPKNRTKFDRDKLSSMEICSDHPNVTLNNSKLYHSTTVYSLIKFPYVDESYEFLGSIINSSLFWWFLYNTGDTLQGDARRMKSNYLNPFPLPKKVSSKTDEIFSQAVNEVMAKKANGRETEVEEHAIDAMVYRLYNLTFEEVKTIDTEFPFSATEYEQIVIS
ncbi:MAG: Eco57I restriction-modification methylase domain-containing protein [Bacteroidia bacterium]|nr:Eco57I restriction-modification methylase domain-containing protein [Bacteroidia bacterium]